MLNPTELSDLATDLHYAVNRMAAGEGNDDNDRRILRAARAALRDSLFDVRLGKPRPFHGPVELIDIVWAASDATINPLPRTERGIFGVIRDLEKVMAGGREKAAEILNLFKGVAEIAESRMLAAS